MNIRFIIREGMLSMQRARLSTFLSILAITFASILLSSFALVFYNVYLASESWQKNIEYEVFLLDSASKQDRERIINVMRKFDGKSEIEFIDKKKAAEVFNKLFKGNSLEILGHNPLPESYRAKLNTGDLKFEKFAKFAAELTKLKGVLTVDYARKQFSSLRKYLNYFYYLSGILGGLVSIVGIFLIYNTVKLSIHARNGIIQTMRLVGATERMIRWPFIVQGGIEGLIGGLFSVGLLWLLIQAIKIYTDLPVAFKLEWLGFVLGLSLVFGILGGRLAIRRYLPIGLQL